MYFIYKKLNIMKMKMEEINVIPIEEQTNFILHALDVLVITNTSIIIIIRLNAYEITLLTSHLEFYLIR